MWYNSAFFEEPDAPHTIIQSSNGVDWYAMKEHGQPPQFAAGETEYNRAQFTCFMPGYEQQIYSVDDSRRSEGHFEVLHETDQEQRFTIRLSMPLPKATIRFMKTAAEASGTLYPEKLLLKENLFMQKESRYTPTMAA